MLGGHRGWGCVAAIDGGSGAQTSLGGNTKHLRQGDERQCHGGERGDPYGRGRRVRQVDQRPCRPKGQYTKPKSGNDSNGNESSFEADSGEPEDAGNTTIRDAGADDLHGPSDCCTQEYVTSPHSAQADIGIISGLKGQEEEASSGAIFHRRSNAGETATAGTRQLQREHLRTRSDPHPGLGRDGRIQTCYVEQQWLTIPSNPRVWGKVSMENWGRTVSDHVGLQDGHQEGDHYLLDTDYYKETDEHKYQWLKHGAVRPIGALTVSHILCKLEPTAQPSIAEQDDQHSDYTLASQFHDRHVALPTQDIDGVRLLQLRAVLLYVMIQPTTTSVDEDVLDDFRARHALEEQDEIERRRRQDWMLMPQRCGLMPPWVSQHGHFYRSTYPENYRPPSRRFHIPNDAEAYDTIRRIDRIWPDIPRSQRPEHHWWVYRLHPSSRDSYNLDVDVTNYILLTHQDIRNFPLHPVVMIEVQRQHRGRHLVFTYARRIGRHQTRVSLIKDTGFVTACAHTHCCRTWINGRSLGHDITTIETADYVLMDMRDLPVRPRAGLDDPALDPQGHIPTSMARNPPPAQAQLADQLAHPTDTLPQEEVCVLRRPDHGDNGQRTITYVGIITEDEVFRVIRNQWRDLAAQRVLVKDVHESFYADFDHDPHQVTLIVLVRKYFVEGATLCGVLVFLRIDGLQDLLSVSLSRETSAVGLLCWAGLLQKCRVARTHTCRVLHDGQVKDGTARILLGNADYIRISAIPSGQTGQSVDFVKLYEDGSAQEDEFLSLWPASATRTGPRATVTVRPVPTKATRLHAGYWITMAWFAWIATLLLMRLQSKRDTVRTKRRRTKTKLVRPRTTMLLLGILCCHHVQPVATLMLHDQRILAEYTAQDSTSDTPYKLKMPDIRIETISDDKRTDTHGPTHLEGLHRPHQKTIQISPWEGLPPPGNPPTDMSSGLLRTELGEELQKYIVDRLTFKACSRQIWQRKIPTPARAQRGQCKQIISLQEALLSVDTSHQIAEQQPQEHVVDQQTRPFRHCPKLMGGVLMHQPGLI